MAQNQTRIFNLKPKYAEAEEGGGEITKIPVQSIWCRLRHTFNWRPRRLGNYNCSSGVQFQDCTDEKIEDCA